MTDSQSFSTFETDPQSQLLNATLVSTFQKRRIGLGLSQRAYAERRGWSAARVSQLENEPIRARLGHLVEALHGSGYALSLIQVGPNFWDDAEADHPEPEGGAVILPFRRRVPAPRWRPSGPRAG